MMSAISTSIYVIKSYTATFYIPANCIYFSLIMNSLIWLKSGTDRFIFILYVSSSMYREKIIFLQLWKKTTTGKLVTIIKKLWIIFFKNILIPFYISPPNRIFKLRKCNVYFFLCFFSINVFLMFLPLFSVFDKYFIMHLCLRFAHLIIYIPIFVQQ